MPYDPATGQWKPETGGAVENVTGMLNSGSDYIKSARASGTDLANQRGLLNSSIATGASEKAAFDAASPLATADASIRAQKDLSAQGAAQNKAIQADQIASTEKIAGQSSATQLQVADMNVKSNSQDKTAAASQNYASIYASMVNNINANKDIPAASRSQYLADAKTFYDNSMALVEQTYNVQLKWSGGAGGGAASAPPSYNNYNSAEDTMNQINNGFR